MIVKETITTNIPAKELDAMCAKVGTTFIRVAERLGWDRSIAYRRRSGEVSTTVQEYHRFVGMIDRENNQRIKEKYAGQKTD